MTTAAKKEAMVFIGVRVPRSLLRRLERLAKAASRRAGVNVKVGTIARKVLEDHA
jgi:hypothetical protein